MAAFCLYMADELQIASASISNYVWALRSYMKFNRQIDPVYGVIEWDDWMSGIQVVAWRASEPRRIVPIALLRKAIDIVARDSWRYNHEVNFRNVQTIVAVLMLLFTFARSETPCPETLGGFDDTQHLQVRDVTVEGGGSSTTPFCSLWRLNP